jgi:hypothetical protein
MLMSNYDDKNGENGNRIQWQHWVLPVVLVLVSAVGSYFFWKSLPEFTNNKLNSIIYAVLSLVMLVGLLGFGYLGLWFGYKWSEKQIDYNRQNKREQHQQKQLETHAKQMETPEVKLQKWQMNSLLELAKLQKETTSEEIDKDGKKKTTTEKIAPETKVKLEELFETISKTPKPE